MWAVSDQWREALAFSNDGFAIGAAVTLGGEALAEFVPESWSWTRRLSGSQIVHEVSLSAIDSDGSLWSGDPAAPLRANGQRLSLTATLSAGGWSESIPLGVWLIGESTPQGGDWRLYPNGKWARPSELVDVQCDDLLALVAEYDWTGLSTPPSGATVASEMARVVAGALPVAVDSTQSVARVPWEGKRIDAVLAMAADIDAVVAVDRTGSLVTIPKAGSGDVIEILPASDQQPLRWGLGLIDWRAGSTREGVYNGVQMTGTAADGSTIYSRMAREEVGPAAWSAAGYGRRLYRASSSLLRTQEQADAAALTRLASLQRERAQMVTVTTVPDPAVDVLDTCRLRLPSNPDATADGIITDIAIGDTGPMTLQVSVPWGVRLDG